MTTFLKLFAFLASFLLLISLSGCEQAEQAKQAVGIESMMGEKAEGGEEKGAEEEGEEEDKKDD